MAFWMAMGFGFDTSPDAYLLLGVPLTAVFQRLVRRRPMRELWVRDGPSVRLQRRTGVAAAAMAAYPAVLAGRSLLAGEWVSTAWLACATAGAFAAAYALGELRPQGKRSVRPVVVAVIVGAAMMVGFAVPTLSMPLETSRMVLTALRTILLYVPVLFVLEEVTFRGALDTHLDTAEQGRGRWSAVVVSALWGLWHLPLSVGAAPLPAVVVSLLVVHTAVGVPLSVAWRRSGNLSGAVIAHALVDAVRNGLVM